MCQPAGQASGHGYINWNTGRWKLPDAVYRRRTTKQLRISSIFADVDTLNESPGVRLRRSVGRLKLGTNDRERDKTPLCRREGQARRQGEFNPISLIRRAAA